MHRTSSQPARTFQMNAAMTPEERCQRQKEALQAQYNTAYEEIVQLQQDAHTRANSLPDCLHAAEAEANGQLVPLTTAHEQSTERTMTAAQSIASTAPTLATTKRHLEELAPHIEAVKQECLEDDDVSEHLKAVRE